jgi:hypothetical protein
VVNSLRKNLLVAAHLLCIALPAGAWAQAEPQAPPPDGSSPTEAKIPKSNEFDPSRASVNMPKVVPGFTNNAALNTLVAPKEDTAPPLSEQDAKKMGEDFEAAASEDAKANAERQKKAGQDDRRNMMRLMNPNKRSSLAPKDDPALDDPASADDLPDDLPDATAPSGSMSAAAPAADTQQAAPRAANSAKSRNRQGAAAAASPDDAPPPLSEAYVKVQTANGVRYKRNNNAATAKPLKDIPPTDDGSDGDATNDEVDAATDPAALPDDGDEEAVDAPAAATRQGPAHRPMRHAKGGKRRGDGAAAPAPEKAAKPNPNDEEMEDLFNKLSQ